MSNNNREVHRYDEGRFGRSNAGNYNRNGGEKRSRDYNNNGNNSYGGGGGGYRHNNYNNSAGRGGFAVGMPERRPPNTGGGHYTGNYHGGGGGGRGGGKGGKGGGRGRGRGRGFQPRGEITTQPTFHFISF